MPFVEPLPRVTIKKYRTGWISDVHLGTRGSNAHALLHFLRMHQFDTLYVIGDLIDVWSLRRGIYWPQSHNDVIQKLLRAGRKGTRIVYIPGNHDEFIAGFFGQYGVVTVAPRAIHVTADGRRLLVIHGHELDAVVQSVKWLAHVGDIGYQLLLKLNAPINALRRMLNLEYWSLSAYVKKSVKNAVSFVGKFEDAIVRYSRADGVDGVVCGHIHAPVIRDLAGVTYYNSGDWVESLSALVEHSDGRMELIMNYTAPVSDELLTDEQIDEIAAGDMASSFDGVASGI